MDVMPVVDLQLEAGLFIKAWVEPQGSLPKVKSLSVALFYVAGRKEATAEGIDVDVRVVAAKIAIMKQLFRASSLVRRRNLSPSFTCAPASQRQRIWTASSTRRGVQSLSLIHI